MIKELLAENELEKLKDISEETDNKEIELLKIEEKDGWTIVESREIKEEDIGEGFIRYEYQ